ncbi:MAG: carbohydrate binding domain-containing protein [Ignavibacteria bacterium]|nr:carbohydrate binding domain-containing protein [Ignavibacteria bacterium]
MVSSVAINSEVYTFSGTNNVEKSVLSQHINIEDACTHAPLANWPVKSGCSSQYWMNYTDNNGDISFNDPNNNGCISITRNVLLNGATSVTPTGNIRYVTAPFVVDFKINGRLVSTSSSFDNVNYNGTGTIPLVNMTTYSTSLQYKVTLYKAPPPSYTATTVVWTYPWNSTFPTGIPTGGMNLPTTPDGLRYIIKLEAKNNCGNIKTITSSFTYNSAAPPINICPNSITLNGGFLNGAVAGNMLLSNARVDNWKRYANSVYVRKTMGCSDLNYITVYGGSNSRSAIYQNTVSVVPGRTYTIKFCGKLSSNSLASTGYLKFYKNSESAANLIGTSPVITSKTNWNNFTLPNWVAPAGVNKIIISGFNTITTRANIDLDNICVEDVSVPSNTTEGNCIDSYSFGWQYDVSIGTLTFYFLSTDLNQTAREFEIAKVPNCWWAPNCSKVDESCPWFNSTARQNLFNGIPNYSNSTYNGPGNGWTNPIVTGNTIVTPGDNFETGYAIIGNPINSFHNVGYWYILRIKCPDGSNNTWQTFLLSECTQTF